MKNTLSEKAIGSSTLTMIRNYGEIITARIRYISPRTFTRDILLSLSQNQFCSQTVRVPKLFFVIKNSGNCPKFEIMRRNFEFWDQLI
jgi:hypothetical protein